MKVGLHEITKGRAESRGWKLFMLLTKLFLSKPSRGGLIPKGRQKERSSVQVNGFLCWKRRWRALWWEGLLKLSDEHIRKTLWSAGQRELLGWRSWVSSQVHVADVEGPL